MNAIEKQFAKIGARVRVGNSRNPWRRRDEYALSIDVRRDKHGEYFDILKGNEVVLNIPHTLPDARHLVLSAKDNDGSHQFLCGHDERHWFVAAVPESTPASGVVSAMEALKPTEIALRQDRAKMKAKKRNKRHNEVFIRQGEWFFVPEPNFNPGKTPILAHEPLTRGRGSKPHMVDELVRFGGEQVYVSYLYPNGLPASEHNKLLKEDPEYRKVNANPMVKDPTVYVRGRIRHPDHKTIRLDGWHRVFMNTEAQSRAMRNVAFLD